MPLHTLGVHVKYVTAEGFAYTGYDLDSLHRLDGSYDPNHWR